MKVWISKYALTDGVVEREMNEYVSDNGTRYATGGGLFLRLDREAHESQEAALKAAEAMRKRKISSVRKQLERLESLTF